MSWSPAPLVARASRAAADLPPLEAAARGLDAAVAAGIMTEADVARVVGVPRGGWRMLAPDVASGRVGERLRALHAVLSVVGRSLGTDAATARWLSAGHARLCGFTPRGLMVARQEGLWILLGSLCRERDGW